jgi:hypothetical protein
MDERAKDFGGEKNKGVVCLKPCETCISIRGDMSEPHWMNERLKKSASHAKKFPKISQARDLSISKSEFGLKVYLDIQQRIVYK